MHNHRKWRDKPMNAYKKYYIWLGFIILASIFLVSCKPSGPVCEEDLQTLSNGAQLKQFEDCSLEIIADGRTTLALASGALPTTRRFKETYIPRMFGTWDIERSNEEEFILQRTDESIHQDDDVLVLGYGSADGTLQGELSVSAEGARRTRLTFAITGGAVDSLALPVRCDADGSFYGFGEQYNKTDQRGEAFSLFIQERIMGVLSGDTRATYFPMPYYLDARGFGILVETDYRVDVDLCKSDANVAWIEVISGEPMELLVFHGPTPLDVIDQLGDTVGRPAAPPDWAYGLWVCSQGGQQDVLDEVAALEAAQIPVSTFWVQDWTGFRQNIGDGFGVQYRWEHDPDFYPDLAGMISDLHGRGYKVLGYVNPFVDAGLLNHFPQMDSEGLLIKHPEFDESYVFGAPCGQASHPDLSNPAARAYVKAAFAAAVTDLGLDGWMADFGEWLPFDARLMDGSDPLAAHNHYPVEWQRLTREVMDELRPDGDWVMFARSGWTGVQGVAQIHWTGDHRTSWDELDGLPSVVPAMLNLGLSGQPYVTHDIAGFSSLFSDPSTKELFLRWTELGAFTPVMRTHEGNQQLTNWSWEKDAETTAHFRRFARIHDALGPELMVLSEQAQQRSVPMVRHLMLQYPEDVEARTIDDQYLLGADLLVAPVVEAGAISRSVYLPAGIWYHLWSGVPYQGGQRITVDAPIGSPPVFARNADRSDLRLIE